jgi:hypothetical protein
MRLGKTSHSSSTAARVTPSSVNGSASIERTGVLLRQCTWISSRNAIAG